MKGTFGVFGVNLGNLWDESDRVSRWSRTLLGYYEEGSIRPVISRSFPLGDAAAAHHYLEERHNIGKVLLLP
jgi:NADPH:quinone reductase-like Zn-dependent oxidoreductase